jgi:hypothetical protein
VSQVVSWIVSELIIIQQHEYNGTMLMRIWNNGKKKLKSLHKSPTVQFNHQEDPGKKAYALKKANMYQEMGKDAQENFAEVGGTWARAGVGLAQHIKSEHPDQRIDWDASIAEEN